MLLSDIFWIGLMVAAIVATIVVAVLESNKKKAAAKLVAASQAVPQDLGESMASLDSFPQEENFDFK